MASISSSEPQVRINLPDSVRRLLAAVRFRARRDAALSGLLLLICLLATIFWITTGIDLGWFAVQRLELPVGLRLILLLVLIPVLIWKVAAGVLYPLVRRVSDTDVALLLERQFPQFQDRLITTVESASGYPREGPLVPGMLQRTVSEADALASTIDAQQVFDLERFRRLALRTGLLLGSIAIFAIAQPGSLPRWWNAFVRCQAVYHLRTTNLVITAIAQPGDRRVEFSEVSGERIYLHPRAADLELELLVPDGGPAEGQDWIVPERVRVDVIRADGSVSRSYVSTTSDRVFRLFVARLQDTVQLEILAGDFRTTVPWRVVPVNPPGLDSVRLSCSFPEYTGWNQQRETFLTVTGSEVALPLGTEFEIQADSAKPLQGARLVTDWFDVSGDRTATRITSRQGISVSQIIAKPLISADGHSIAAKFQVILTPPVDDLQAGMPGQSPTDAGGAVVDESAAEGEAGSAEYPGFLPIASNTAIRFFLHDDDDVMSVNPEVLRIRGIEDRAPLIVARGVGIDNAVTRLARIPIAGRITDDYGLVSAGFQFLVDDESNWRPRPFRRPVPLLATEFVLRRSDSEPFELFEVQPLELSEGQTLTLAIAAEDGNTLTGPGSSRSEPMVFRIVSNEDLLSLLYTREITLRRRLEEAVSQLEQIRDDLRFHQAAARRADSDDTTISRPEDRTALTTCATRSANSLRRQTNEVTSIAEGFEEIVRQLINNSIPPQQLAQNMQEQILLPLFRVTDAPMLEADRSLGEFSVAAAAGRKTETLVIQSEERVTVVITALKQILENVRDLAEFHEALRDLKAILEDQQRLTDEIKALQKRALIDQL